jgi:hypothetical protein
MTKNITAPSVSTTPPRKKSNESINPMSIEDFTNAPLTRRKSTDSMMIDVEVNSSPVVAPVQDLTINEFNYTMKLMDEKINSIYKLCRYIGDQQREMATALKKLVALDELSENFWNVSYLYTLKSFFFIFKIIKIIIFAACF